MKKTTNVAEGVLGTIKVNGRDATIVRLAPINGKPVLALRIAGVPSDELVDALKDAGASGEDLCGWRFSSEEAEADLLDALKAAGLSYETWLAEYDPYDGIVLTLREEAA